MARLCHLCREDLKDKIKCKNCGAWNMETGNEEKKGTSLNGEDPDGTITLDKVQAEDAARILTGPWDYCWGGGIVQTSTTLIGGSPGAGKTTLLLDIANRVAATLPLLTYEKGEGQALYIAAEQSAPEIQLTAERLDLKHKKNIRMVPAMGGYANLGEILYRRKPKLAVLDSLQGLTGDDNAAQIGVLEILKKVAVELKCPIIIINQVTKDGELAGLNTLQHHVDTTLTFFPDDIEVIDPDIDANGVPQSETKARILEVRKNRFGRAWINQAFAMTSKGLKHVPNYEELIEESADGESEE